MQLVVKGVYTLYYEPLTEHEINGLDYRYVYGNNRLSVNITGVDTSSGNIVENGKVNKMRKKAFSMLITFAIFLSISGCKVPPPRLMPSYGDELCSVWISENPQAFITRAYKNLGGQMEINGDLCTIEIMILDDDSLSIRKFEDVYYFDEITGKYKRNAEDTISSLFESDTVYKKDSIIIKVHRRNKYFAGQKIVFTKYAKDEVTPAEFGFDLEEWDYFVPVEMREEYAGSSSPEETPIPTPVPEPTPAPALPPEQGLKYESVATVIPSRRRFLPRS